MDLFAGELNKTLILEVHNHYRNSIGIKDLIWSETLASSAQQWADYLARRTVFHHSQGEYGENIWQGSAGYYSQKDMIDHWASEKQFYLPGKPYPNDCQRGKICGHYTQIVWRDTQVVGCGLASARDVDYFVCQYDPPGNYLTEIAY